MLAGGESANPTKRHQSRAQAQPHARGRTGKRNRLRMHEGGDASRTSYRLALATHGTGYRKEEHMAMGWTMADLAYKNQQEIMALTRENERLHIKLTEAEQKLERLEAERDELKRKLNEQ